jgi:YtcA family
MSNPESLAGLFCTPMLGSWAGLSSYTPSLDVYGSYFPAWLICLAVGVMLTIGVRLIGVLNLGVVRMLGPLVPISLILIFSITTWFLFFVA